MISEVARSSNVNNGAKQDGQISSTDFYFNICITSNSYIRVDSNAALAAMLITVGIKLAHPKEFIHTFQIGKEIYLLVTIFGNIIRRFTYWYCCGMVLKIIIHLINGTPIFVI